ncbi:MAG: HepT-like ribonuclease domain-containing protein [Longimicrobiales bacterium]
MNWRDQRLILDMLLEARRLRSFVEGKTRADLTGDDLLRYAVLHAITLFGEAARGVSAEAKAASPGIPWNDIIAMRNRLVHEYFHIRAQTVWSTASRDIPALIPLLEQIAPPLEES